MSGGRKIWEERPEIFAVGAQDQLATAYQIFSVEVGLRVAKQRSCTLCMFWLLLLLVLAEEFVLVAEELRPTKKE